MANNHFSIHAHSPFSKCFSPVGEVGLGNIYSGGLLVEWNSKNQNFEIIKWVVGLGLEYPPLLYSLHVRGCGGVGVVCFKILLYNYEVLEFGF